MEENVSTNYSHLTKQVQSQSERILQLQRQNNEISKERDLYLSIFSRLSDIAYSYSTKRGAIYHSPQVEKILGYTHSELLQNPMLWHDSIHPDDIRFVDKTIEKFVAGRPFEIEYRIKDANGFWHWFKDRSVGQRVGKDEIIIDGIATDITNLKQAEKNLSASSNLNKLLLDSLPHPAMLIDKNRIVKATNKVARDAGVEVGEYCWSTFGHCDYLPQEKKDLINKTPDCSKDDFFCTFCLAERMKESNLVQNNPDIEAFGKNWDTWWVPVNKETYLHYAIDITEKKRFERKIRNAHDRLLSILDGLEAIVYVADYATYDLLYMNQYSIEKFGNPSNKKCWEHLQRNQKKPCDFCKTNLLDPEVKNKKNFILWEQKNSFDGRWYLSRDQIMDWEGSRKVRLHISTDITHIKENEFFLEKLVQDRTDKLTKEIEKRSDAEQELIEKQNFLTESNIALKSMLDTRDTERRALEENFYMNIKKYILPYVKQIKEKNINANLSISIHLLETSIDHLLEPSSKKLYSKYSTLTPMEIKVADLVKQGIRTKEIAEFLNIAPGSVSTYRNNIRKKFNLRNNKINLRVFLNSLEN